MKNPLKTGLLIDRRYENHDPGAGHPERPARISSILAALTKAELTEEKSPNIKRIAPRHATADEVRLCHSGDYVRLAETEITRGDKTLSTGDTNVCAASLETAYLATGGVLETVDTLFRGEIANAFCAIRPPGHHATPNRGMGFCVFNNIAIAARYAQKNHGVKRVLIADWDVHHGNGTQDIFYEDGSVFFFSTHQWPLYPGTGRTTDTGAGKGLGFTMNFPLPKGTRQAVLDAFKDKLVPEMKKFKPELILISAGFDSREGDPLGGFKLTDADFAELTRLMLDMAQEHCSGRLISVLEGGYNLDGLASAAAAHVRELQKGEAKD
ncbi:MAG TPA: histone deacetylase [Planctomycetota bacterium]|nr:histone deacetylase [Planctomycetota bacterium]